MKKLFCNIGWMKYYDGLPNDDSIVNGGKFIEENKTGFEVCNFSDVDGMVYGYVEPGGHGKDIEKKTIKIERIGAGKKDASVSGVTVVWTASDPTNKGMAMATVVGWYKNATVYREFQPLDKKSKIQKENNIRGYRITAKAENFTRLPHDERFVLIPRNKKGRKGFMRSNVWYANSPESKIHVERVLNYIETGYSIELQDVDTLDSGKEGNSRLVTHLRKERNPKLVKRKKDSILAKEGKLICDVCNFDFKEFYGEIGEGFCEVHHLHPIAKMDGEVETTLSDLAIVCSNCHRMIHRQSEMLTIPELRKIIKSRFLLSK